LWHDTQETRTGDLPQTAGAYLAKPEPRQITADQTENLPGRSREMICGAVDEYESRLTLEALCAKDADKLEMLLQAVEYRDIGVNRVEGWIESARKDLKTPTAQRIAEAALTQSPSPGVTGSGRRSAGAEWDSGAVHSTGSGGRG
jgi:putative hydrolase of HD superfamily